jgi:hypothetical protein
MLVVAEHRVFAAFDGDEPDIGERAQALGKRVGPDWIGDAVARTMHEQHLLPGDAGCDVTCVDVGGQDRDTRHFWMPGGQQRGAASE